MIATERLNPANYSLTPLKGFNNNFGGKNTLKEKGFSLIMGQKEAPKGNGPEKLRGDKENTSQKPGQKRKENGVETAFYWPGSLLKEEGAEIRDNSLKPASGQGEIGREIAGEGLLLNKPGGENLAGQALSLNSEENMDYTGIINSAEYEDIKNEGLLKQQAPAEDNKENSPPAEVKEPLPSAEKNISLKGAGAKESSLLGGQKGLSEESPPNNKFFEVLSGEPKGGEDFTDRDESLIKENPIKEGPLKESLVKESLIKQELSQGELPKEESVGEETGFKKDIRGADYIMQGDSQAGSDIKTQLTPGVKEAQSTPIQEPKAFIQIAEKIPRDLKEGLTNIRIKLSPEGLGEVTVNLICREGKISLDISAAMASTQKLLESQAGELKAALQNREYDVRGVNISSHQGQNFEGFAFSHQNYSSRGHFSPKNLAYMNMAREADLNKEKALGGLYFGGRLNYRV